MTDPNTYIPDWTEQDGPYEEEAEAAAQERYDSYQEDMDEEERYNQMEATK